VIPLVGEGGPLRLAQAGLTRHQRGPPPLDPRPGRPIEQAAGQLEELGQGEAGLTEHRQVHGRQTLVIRAGPAMGVVVQGDARDARSTSGPDSGLQQRSGEIDHVETEDDVGLG
jgi:hypothetical protein